MLHSFHQASSFNFSFIGKNAVLKEIRSFSTTKACKDTDIPVKFLTENSDYFGEFIYIQFNESISSSKFPSSFKCANITTILKDQSRNHKNNSISQYLTYSFKNL